MKTPPALRTSEWIWLAVLWAAVTAFHVRGLRPGYAFLPIDNVNNNLPWRSGPFALGGLQNPLIGDPIYQFYPILVNQLQAIRSGHWPLWSPSVLLGQPLLGDPLAQTFYPVFIGLGLVFGPARGLTVGYWLHALLAAGFTYAWLRAARLGQAGAFVGGLTYALGGFMVTWLETTFWVSTLAWLPGVLWMYECAVRRRGLAEAAVAGCFLGVAALAGQFSFVLAFGVFLSLYAAGHAAQAARQHRRLDAWPLFSLGVVFVLGGLIAAVQILPFMDTLAQSHRAAGVGLLTAPWQQAVTLLVPNFYGNPVTTRTYWGAANYSEAVVYAGLVPLVLAALAVIVSRRLWPVYLFGLSLATTYLAYGGPGTSLLADLPFVKYVALGRSLFLLPLIMAFLAGTALDVTRFSLRALSTVAAGLCALVAWAWFGNWGGAQAHAAQLRGPLIWAAVLLAITVLLLLAQDSWYTKRAWTAWLLAGWVFVDLFAWGSGFNPALPIDRLPAATPAIAFLQAQAPPYRVATLQSEGEILFGPNYLSVFGLDDLNGYSSLLPRSLAELVAAGDPASGGYNGNTIWLGSPSLRLLDLLQARFIVSQAPRPDPAPRAEHLGGCASQTPELNRDQAITATVVVASLAINRLDLELRVAPGSGPTGDVAVRMWQGPQRTRLMLDSHADISQATDHQRLTFYFAPEADAPGHVYEWEASTTSPHTGVALCTEVSGQPSASLYGVDWQPAYQGELNITERLGRLPRAYVVYSAETVSGDTAAVQRVLDETFDVRNTALVSQAVALPAQVALPATPADILSYGDTDIVLHATATRAGLLVLGDQAYPGWQAWVDGRPAAVLTANVVWRGVLLPPGDHQVEFKLEPFSLKLGLALTAFGLLLAASVFVIGRWSRPAG